MKLFFHRLRNPSEFLRNVLTLMTGTTLAQAIPIAMMPILTRLYTPEDFGVLALYMAIASIFSVIATARYELAVMLPDKEKDAASVVALSFCVALTISVLLLSIAYFFYEEINDLLGGRIGQWLYFVPLSVLMAGIYQSLNYWNNRHKNFQRLAFGKLAQGAGGTGTQVILSVLPSGSGLIFGQLIGQLSALMVFIRYIWGVDRKLIFSVSMKDILKNAWIYRKFPKYSMFGSVLDSTALQMPILFLNRFFDAHVAGMFSLTFRAINLPMSLISMALSQVLFQKIVEIHKSRPEELYGYIIKIFCFLLALMIPAVVVVSFFGDELFAFVFGEVWRPAGQYATYLIFAVAIRFAVSPLSVVLAMEHNIRVSTLWQTIYFITLSSVLFFCRYMDFVAFVSIFVVHEIILYSLYLVLILRSCRLKPKGY